MKILVFLFVAATMLLSASLLFGAPIHYDAKDGYEFTLHDNAPMSHSGEVSNDSEYNMEGPKLVSFTIICHGVIGSCYVMDSNMRGITVGAISAQPSGDPVSQITEGVAVEVVNP